MKAATQATAIAIVSYSDIEDDDATLGPLFTNLTSRTKTWIVSAAGFYRLIEQDGVFLDGMAGLRYWSVDSSLNLGYQWTPAFSTTVGYRYLDVDYDEDNFLYDVYQDGLVLGLSWRF